MWINRNAVPVGPFPKNAITAKICGSVIQLDNCLRGKNKNIYPALHMINLILYKCVSTTNLESDTCNPHRRLKQRHKKTFKVKQVTLWEVPHLDPVKYVVWKEHQPVGPSQQARMGHGWISCENWVNMKVEDVCLLRYQYTQDGGSGGIIHNKYIYIKKNKQKSHPSHTTIGVAYHSFRTTHLKGPSDKQMFLVTKF